MSAESEKNTYRVQGFSCANCAATFEKNVNQLSSVEEANVNFGAAKLTVYGSATIQELEKAGAFENLKLRPEHEKAAEKEEHFLKRHWGVLISSFLLIIGWILVFPSGEDSLPAISLFAASIVIGGHRLFRAGLANLFRLQFDMKTLMTIAIIGAALIGEWGEGATVVILFAISEALEAYSMDRARKSISSLMDIAPKEAFIRRGHHEVSVPVDDIEVGDIMIVKPGQKIAMDGIVVKGGSSVNQAAITGESVPVYKSEGSDVFAGTLNEEGLLEIKVTKKVNDTTIAKIIHLVEEAQSERAPSQAFVDTFAKYYTPLIILVAALVAVIPPLFFAADWSAWIYQGLAVLVVGCPCALVISTPVAIVTAIGHAARKGILIKGGIYLEEAARISAVAFDKTGTLTHGKPKVTSFQPAESGVSPEEVIVIMAALEKQSQHPLGTAIVRWAEEQKLGFEEVEVTEFLSVTGKGIKGKINEVHYMIGKPEFIEQELSQPLSLEMKNRIQEEQQQGRTVMLAADVNRVLGLVSVADTVRESSRKAISSIHQLGVKETLMLTGDNPETARAIGHETGVSRVFAELMPQDKLQKIKELRDTYGTVAMVGDGVNDAPALAAASVGVAMGGAGTDTALETADIALMGDDPAKLSFTIKLSRKALSIIKQNITFSLLIKVLALLLVIPGWLTLWIAIFADMGATLLVTLNGLRLLKVKE
ncbi:cadmium-translocating P-type ATPase [Bacillus lacus]|uniref:Cd(2+)-exporting ATPase n=1 Tax=Metabacillus lacus TaxID=1983721 RepID=A0A7X2LZB9_9BACI|nr:cadmium-translocating P-type ATPase [Metabacillus lacus]